MKPYAIYARLGAGIMLIVFWGLFDSPLFGVIFILMLAILAAVRYRVAPYPWLSGLELALCVGYGVFWPPALLGVWLPAISWLENKWHKQEQELLDKSYENRTERLKLESALALQELDARNAASLAEMTERTRIAQEIHDHVGHEISGAAIALQAVIKLYEKDDPRTGEMLAQTVSRLDSASEHLRETVHNLKPAIDWGVDTLEDICDGFDFCSVNFTAAGDLSNVPHWELLASNLKEALTNVMRHSAADSVIIRLDGNSKNIRMIVTDNGKSHIPFKQSKAFALYEPGSGGLGLSGMKERTRMAGGTMTINATTEYFQLVFVLPK